MTNQDKKGEKQFVTEDEEETVATGKVDEQAELAGQSDYSDPEGGG